jgi:alginate O-acetyltransferase complex protein AlgI
MLFNSISFAFFLPVVFTFYWLAYKSLRIQNLCLLIGSCYFYGSWDYRFLFLLFFSISLDYFTGIRMETASNKSTRKFWLFLSVFINLGFLGLFKYYNFFAQSFADFLELLGFRTQVASLSLILPVGISFYTFHGLSYIIDIYKGRIKPERDFINYSLFVSFFPLLVAGPIERATHLLPQIKKERHFEYTEAVAGMRQILWGLFKKMVIADNCADFANMIFDHSSAYSGSTLVLGAVFFTFQIYCDFSGYSEMALGIARLFGFDLFRNFAFPYFSRDIAEFWRRWHISLSSWFRDYLYIPLGGSRGSTWLKVRNILIIFLVSGFWHGANWTFLAWGLLNAIYILPSILLGTNKTYRDTVAHGRYLPSFRELFAMAFTFSLTVFAWIFFRAKNIHHAFEYVSAIFSRSLFKRPEMSRDALTILLLTSVFMVVEWLGREQYYALASINNKFNRLTCYLIYFVIIICIFYFSGKEQAFIYFQF